MLLYLIHSLMKEETNVQTIFGIIGAMLIVLLFCWILDMMLYDYTPLFSSDKHVETKKSAEQIQDDRYSDERFDRQQAGWGGY